MSKPNYAAMTDQIAIELSRLQRGPQGQECLRADVKLMPGNLQSEGSSLACGSMPSDKIDP